MNIALVDPPEAAEAPRSPLGPAPLRRPGSIRRTSSLDSTWPDGADAPWQVEGLARDLFTPADGGPGRVLAQAHINLTVTQERAIAAIAATPPDPRLEGLVGCRGGGHLRQAIEDALPGERQAGTPLYLLLDDISGASLVARWAWSRWTDDWRKKTSAVSRNMENICTGFRSGASSLQIVQGDPSRQNAAAVGPLGHPDDPQSWHPLKVHAEISMRRARRIDVWVEGDLIQIESSFQDSASVPEGGRVAIHEYGLRATAEAATGKLLSVVADPRILPFRSCPAAVDNIGKLLGSPLGELRTRVLEVLPGALGCTHLNDALRALAEAPVLARRVQETTLAD